MQIYKVCFFLQLESGSIEIHRPELNEQLSLSTADLRFADYLINHVKEYVEKGEQEAGKFMELVITDMQTLHSPCPFMILAHGPSARTFKNCILCTLLRVIRLVRIG